jgi:hypothetical protein
MLKQTSHKPTTFCPTALNQLHKCSKLLSKTTYTEPDRKENRTQCELFCPAEKPTKQRAFSSSNTGLQNNAADISVRYLNIQRYRYIGKSDG